MSCRVFPRVRHAASPAPSPALIRVGLPYISLQIYRFTVPASDGALFFGRGDAACCRALIAARALLTGFLLRERSFAVTSDTPPSSRTVLTDEPATRPLPGLGRISTRDAQNFAATLCRMLRFLERLMVIMARFAARVAFSMASAVSAALPKPTPTRPFLSPSTRAALKLKRRPQS